MKKFYVIFSVMFLCAISPVNAIQTISSGGETAVFDDVNNKCWISDLSMFANRTYNQQIAEIGSLSYFGLNDWRMASQEEMEGLWPLISYPAVYMACYLIKPTFG